MNALSDILLLYKSNSSSQAFNCTASRTVCLYTVCSVLVHIYVSRLYVVVGTTLAGVLLSEPVFLAKTLCQSTYPSDLTLAGVLLSEPAKIFPPMAGVLLSEPAKIFPPMFVHRVYT